VRERWRGSERGGRGVRRGGGGVGEVAGELRERWRGSERGGGGVREVAGERESKLPYISAIYLHYRTSTNTFMTTVQPHSISHPAVL
jgi:hypothetical protein